MSDPCADTFLLCALIGLRDHLRVVIHAKNLPGGADDASERNCVNAGTAADVQHGIALSDLHARIGALFKMAEKGSDGLKIFWADVSFGPVHCATSLGLSQPVHH